MNIDTIREASYVTEFPTLRAAAWTRTEAPEDGTQCFVPRLKSGDPKAFDDLYQMYHRRVFGVILRIVDCPETAEDLAQESFLRLWRNSSHLKTEYSCVGPWLMKIARNCALDYRKSMNSNRHEQIADQVAACEAEAENLTLNRCLLKQVFEQLPLEQQEVIRLAFYQGLSQADIAQKLGQPLGTVKGRVRLALAKLRAAIETGESHSERMAVRYH